MAEKKEKRYVSDNAKLMVEWNWVKNSELGFDPQELTLGSERKVWWICSNRHEWQATIINRFKGNGCPYCSGKKVLCGYNDLQTINPTISNEWNHERNHGLMPENFTAHSGKKVWWKCKQGHEWQASIYSRNNGHGCPYCSGRLAVAGQNDLQTVNPSLAKEWNFEKNNGLSPTDVLPSCGKKVWWICNKGHEWQATINHRNNGRGCPICKTGQKTSFPEYAFIYYLEKYGFQTIHLFKDNGYELDVYIPSRKIAIEYDGYLWHKGKEKKDLEKNRKCAQDGITLYRVREGLQSLNDSSIDYLVHRDQGNLSKILKEVLTILIGPYIDVDIKRDSILIENLREHAEKECSFLLINPTIAKEWNYEKNGKLMPENVTANTTKKVWWRCNEGHEWQATIASRNKGHGCPYCSGRYPVINENDLLTVNPTLANEWNYEKNSLNPQHLKPNSGKKYGGYVVKDTSGKQR